MKQIYDYAEQNQGPIADALDGLLPTKGLILEIASNSGQHVAYLARRFPHLMWQPSDPRPDARKSIMAHLEHSGLSNVRAPLDLDTTKDSWPIAKAEAIVCINLVTASRREATVGLFSRSAELLGQGQPLFVYVGEKPNDELPHVAQPAFRLLKALEMPGGAHLLYFERNGSSGQSGSAPRK